MPRRRLRPCKVPNCPHVQDGPRCDQHSLEHGRFQRATTPTKVHRDADRPRRAAAVAAHRAQHGDWCPGWGRPAHASTDLTADHIVEISHGGAPDGDLQVLCRSCNSRKAQQPAGSSSNEPTPQADDAPRGGE